MTKLGLALCVTLLAVSTAQYPQFPSNFPSLARNDEEVMIGGPRTPTVGYPSPMDVDSSDGGVDMIPGTHTPNMGYPAPMQQPADIQRFRAHYPLPDVSLNQAPSAASGPLSYNQLSSWAKGLNIPAPPAFPDLPAVPDLPAGAI